MNWFSASETMTFSPAVRPVKFTVSSTWTPSSRLMRRVAEYPIEASGQVLHKIKHMSCHVLHCAATGSSICIVDLAIGRAEGRKVLPANDRYLQDFA